MVLYGTYGITRIDVDTWLTAALGSILAGNYTQVPYRPTQVMSLEGLRLFSTLLFLDIPQHGWKNEVV